MHIVLKWFINIVLTASVWEATIEALWFGTGSHDRGFMNWYYFLLNIFLEKAINCVLFVLLVSRIVKRKCPIGNLEATYSKNMAASSSSTGLHENIHSGFSSESDSNISIETESGTYIVVTVKPVLWVIYRILTGIIVNGTKS